MVTALAVACSTGLVASSAAAPLIADRVDWTCQLRLLANLGYCHLDLSDFWIALAALDDAGLIPVGAWVVGAELHDPARREERIDRVTAALGNAVRLGLPHVSLGFQPKPTPGGVPGARPGWAEVAGGPRS